MTLILVIGLGAYVVCSVIATVAYCLHARRVRREVRRRLMER
jgi:hypothetical protein